MYDSSRYFSFVADSKAVKSGFGTGAGKVVHASERYATMRRVTVAGAALDLVLGAAKILGGGWSHSQALVADGVHSLSDLATDVLVLYAAKHAHVDPDLEHPYGHARIETAASAVLGAVLILVAAGIVANAVSRLFDPELLTVPKAAALAFALVSVVSKEAMYRYTMHHARRLGSPLLKANAWHTRSDAASSLVVIVGVGGAMAGLAYLDAVAAVVVAWMVARIGFRVAKSGMAELIDTGLDAEQLALIRRLILSVEGVADLHQLRTRRMGGRVLVDVHVMLSDPHMSLSEGHQISEAVRHMLTRSLEDVSDVTVHADPEDDTALASAPLPTRRELLARLEDRFRAIEAAAQIRRVTLHYLDSRIHLELELPLSLLAGEVSADGLERAFARALESDPDVAGVRLVFSGAGHAP